MDHEEMILGLIFVLNINMSVAILILQCCNINNVHIRQSFLVLHMCVMVRRLFTLRLLLDKQQQQQQQWQWVMHSSSSLGIQLQLEKQKQKRRPSQSYWRFTFICLAFFTFYITRMFFVTCEQRQRLFQCTDRYIEECGRGGKRCPGYGL